MNLERELEVPINEVFTVYLDMDVDVPIEQAIRVNQDVLVDTLIPISMNLTEKELSFKDLRVPIDTEVFIDDVIELDVKVPLIRT